MSVIAKICGLKDKKDVQAAVAGGADYLGFVFFHKSPRNISPKQAFRLTKDLPKHVKTVSVVVDASDADLEVMFKDFKPDYIQCHGSESQERISEINKKYNIPVIKAVAVRSSDDVAKGKSFANNADMLLFDAKVPESPLPGGNGLAFDWTLLKAKEFLVPWFLSGGLNMQNVKEAIDISGASAVDVSSSLESEPGIKDPELITQFLKTVKGIS